MENESIYSNVQVATRPNQNTALVEIEQQRAISEVQGAIVLAKRFPRNQIEAMDKILTSCQRPGLAEAIIQSWGNAQFGIRELEQRNNESTVEAFAWDVENNIKQVKTFQVKHERFTKKGRYALEDPREIYELTANNGARRLRACILGIIPGDVIDAAVNQCEATLKAKADTSPEALKKLVEAFENFKVSKEQIEKRIQRRLDTITAAQLVQLRKIYNSMKDGMSAAADWFEILTDKEEIKKDASEGLKDKIKNAKGKGIEEAPKMATAPCPDNPGVTYTEKQCLKCEKREGCPAWPK